MIADACSNSCKITNVKVAGKIDNNCQYGFRKWWNNKSCSLKM